MPRRWSQTPHRTNRVHSRPPVNGTVRRTYSAISGAFGAITLPNFLKELSAIADGQTLLDRLTPLSGTVSDGTWRITTSDRDDANGRLAICAIVKRPPSASPSLKGTDGSELIGTGFYLVPDGGFATARHVALEALDAMSQGEHCVGLVYSLSTACSHVRFQGSDAIIFPQRRKGPARRSAQPETGPKDAG